MFSMATGVICSFVPVNDGEVMPAERKVKRMARSGGGGDKHVLCGEPENGTYLESCREGKVNSESAAGSSVSDTAV